MIDEKTPVARIDQNGRKAGIIRIDQSVEWINPLSGRHAGQEKYIEEITRKTLDTIAARGAILAAMDLKDTYNGTDIVFTLLVDTMFGTEPDVID